MVRGPITIPSSTAVMLSSMCIEDITADVLISVVVGCEASFSDKRAANSASALSASARKKFAFMLREECVLGSTWVDRFMW